MDLIIGTPVKPQLSKDVVKRMDKVQYPCQIEGKYDGIRAQVHVHEDGKIQLFSRSLKEITNAFPDIVMILQDEEIKSGIYDGEIYGINSDYTPMPFEKFQHRINVKKITNEIVKKYPATIVLFDIIYHKNGYHNEVQFRRMQLLESCTSYWSPWRIVDNEQELLKSFGHAIDMGYEGIIIKNMYGSYLFGEGKTAWKNWLKYKGNGETLDVVIIDAQMGIGKRSKVLASYNIAVLKEPGVLYSVGSVGSGFTDEELESLTFKAKMAEGIQHLNIVIEVKFDKVSHNEDGEYALRFPRFIRFRPDKMIHEIDTLDKVKEMVK